MESGWLLGVGFIGGAFLMVLWYTVMIASSALSWANTVINDLGPKDERNVIQLMFMALFGYEWNPKKGRYETTEKPLGCFPSDKDSSNWRSDHDCWYAYFWAVGLIAGLYVWIASFVAAIGLIFWPIALPIVLFISVVYIARNAKRKQKQKEQDESLVSDKEKS